MADSPLIDIFDLCVERLAAGETVEDCVRDYPEHADELRGLLQTGFLVFQAQANPADEQQAQAQTRTRIENALQTDFGLYRGNNSMPTDQDPPKKKNTRLTVRRTVIMLGGAAAAIFAFSFGFAFATAPMQGPKVVDASVYMTNVYLRDLLATESARVVTANPDDVFITTATAYVREITQTAIALALDGTPMPLSPRDELSMTQTAIFLGIGPSADVDTDRDGLNDSQEFDFSTDPKIADTDGDGLSDGDEVNVWDTSPFYSDTDGDEVSDGDEINVKGTDPHRNEAENDFILTATQYVLEITQTAQAVLGESNLASLPTVTASPSPTALPTATRQFARSTLAPIGTPEPPRGGGAAGGDTAITGEIVSTSVASYLGMTATPAAVNAAPEVYNEAEAGTLEEPLAPPVVSDDRERDVAKDKDEFAEGRTDSSIVPYSGDAIPVVLPTILPSSGVLGLDAPIINAQQLDPMKAGEIDDNAEWDTYMEFRRNYIDTYGAWGVHDFDVSGRRIIKVVDALGKPILGAHVEVYMERLKVSDTMTYATGLTMFFPNADERTKRRDVFTVIVTSDQYQVDYVLDLRTVGDVLEIQMPIVIVRAPSANDVSIPRPDAAAENAATAAENAAAAADLAATAAENARYMAETATYLAGTALPPTYTPTPATR